MSTHETCAVATPSVAATPTMPVASLKNECIMIPQVCLVEGLKVKVSKKGAACCGRVCAVQFKL